MTSANTRARHPRVLLRALWNALEDMFVVHYGYHSAALSYYTIIAIIPLVLVITSVVSYLPFESFQLNRIMTDLLPSMVVQLEHVKRVVAGTLINGRSVYGLVGFGIAYYLASNLFVGIHISLQTMFGRSLKKVRTSFIIQLISIPAVILLLVVINLSEVILSVGVGAIMKISFLSRYLSWTQAIVVLNVANLVSFVTFFLVFFFCYYFLAAQPRVLVRHSILLAFLVSLFTTIVKGLFGVIVFIMMGVNPVYGTFGGIFSFFGWIYTLFMALLVGARTIYYLDPDRRIPRQTPDSDNIQHPNEQS